MEEITVELDDETAAWLEAIAMEQKKPTSDIVAEFIRRHHEEYCARERGTG